jgi:hypothetical protein
VATRTLTIAYPETLWLSLKESPETFEAEVLGALASPVSKVPPANVRCMGCGVDPAFFLGAGLLSAATRQGQSPSGRGTGTGVQMDPHPLSVLAGAHAVQ